MPRPWSRRRSGAACGCLTVGRSGEGIRLLETAIDGFAQTLKLAYAGGDYRRPPAAGRRVPGRECAGRGRPCHCDRQRAGARLRGAGASRRAPRAGSSSSASSNGAPIFVDYAHKPDALAKALEALRPYATGSLIVVFGCGGDRDHGKRPMMGAIAAELADRVIVTDDNPRSENPAAIRAAILAAAPGAIEIGDRGEAIRASIAQLRRGDVLLIAGKGHETGQIVGNRCCRSATTTRSRPRSRGGSA